MKDTRIKQNYVLKNEKVFVGLEDSKKTYVITVRSNNMIVHETRMPAKHDVFLGYLRNNFPVCKISVMYEAGFKGFNLYEKLILNDIHCVVTPPHTLTQSKTEKIKNDRADARRLALNLEKGDYSTCHVPDRELLADRQIERLLEQVIKQTICTKNRIRRALEFHGLDDAFKSGTWSDKDYKDLPKKLLVLDISESLLYSFTFWLHQLSACRSQREELLKKLRQISKKDRYKEYVKILKSCPGVGFLTAIRLVLEWGTDMARFVKGKSFAKFTGLIPGEHSTGEKDHKGHIIKQGNRYVRKWLVEVAWMAIKKDPALLAAYTRIYRNTRSKKKAIVAIARKLALRLRAIMLSKEMYELRVIK